jgi:hypothetical protein
VNTRTVACLGAAAALVLSACGATDDLTEEAVEKATGGEVKVKKKGSEVEVEVGGRKLQNEQGGLVDGFPKDVPLPPGYAVSTSTKLEGQTYQAFGRLPDQDRALAFFKDNLSKEEWRIEAARSGADSFQVIANRGKRKLVVNSTGQNEGANMTVVVDG